MIIWCCWVTNEVLLEAFDFCVEDVFVFGSFGNFVHIKSIKLNKQGPRYEPTKSPKYYLINIVNINQILSSFSTSLRPPLASISSFSSSTTPTIPITSLLSCFSAVIPAYTHPFAFLTIYYHFIVISSSKRFPQIILPLFTDHSFHPYPHWTTLKFICKTVHSHQITFFTLTIASILCFW